MYDLLQLYVGSSAFCGTSPAPYLRDLLFRPSPSKGRLGCSTGCDLFNRSNEFDYWKLQRSLLFNCTRPLIHSLPRMPVAVANEELSSYVAVTDK